MGEVSDQSFFEDRFAPLRDAFVANFEAGLEIGAQCAVTVDGMKVVHLVGGAKDRAGRAPMTDDTVMRIFSSGKAVIALLVACAVESEDLCYDTPVAHYWPEFGVHGKDKITVADALSHQAGVCGFKDKMDAALWLDWEGLSARLAALEPLWPPGSAHGYHPHTVGFIAGEILRRTTGFKIGERLAHSYHGRDECSSALDVFSGLDAATYQRAATIKKPPAPPSIGEITELKKIAFMTPWAYGRGESSGHMAGADIPASNMYATASGLADILIPLAMKTPPVGGAGISKSTRAALTKVRAAGPDLCLGIECRWGAGVMLNTDQRYGPEPQTFGHSGFGGSCVFVDPARQMTFAYVMNKLSPHAVDDPRAKALIKALYRCV